MTQKTSVHRNRITIDDRTYEARVLGGGKFNVFTTAGVHIGSFQVRGRAVEVEEVGVEGADPVEQIGLLWVRENLSAQPADYKPSEPAKAAETKPIAMSPERPAAPAPPAARPPEARPAEPKPVEQRPAAPAAAAPPIPDPRASDPQAADAQGPSAQPAGTAGKSICRIATHARPDAAGFQMAKAYQKWLRTQPGVQAAYLSHDAESGKTVSVTIWESKEQLAAMRYAKPPHGAVQLKSLTVDLLWIVG